MKDLTIRELLDYAKDNGFNTVKFYCPSKLFTGKFLDAYFEFVQLPLLGDGFVRICDIEKEFGYNLKFDIIDDDEYKSLTNLSFVIRGKIAPYGYKEV